MQAGSDFSPRGGPLVDLRQFNLCLFWIHAGFELLGYANGVDLVGDAGGHATHIRLHGRGRFLLGFQFPTLFP